MRLTSAPKAPGPVMVNPFFTAMGSVPHNSRRVLLLSYHFPPSRAAGALRWRKLARLAAERGWVLDVVVLDPASLPSRDPEGLADLPAGTRVFAVVQPVPRLQRFVTHLLAQLRRLGRTTHAQEHAPPRHSSPRSVARRPTFWSRTYSALVDLAGGAAWASRAATLGARLARATPYEAVVSCGPPHIAHVAAARIARTRRVPLILDLRDPWRLVERLPDPMDSPLWRWHAAWRESYVVPRADLIVMNTEPARDAMQARYPRAASRIIAAPNGFDDEATPPAPRLHRFVLAYSGSIYLDRDPRPLFEAARRVITSADLTPAEFGISLIGEVQSYRDTPTTELARQAGIEAYVDLVPHCPRDELRGLLARAAILVSLPQDSHMAIPSKLFEYMQFDAWILALAEPYSATARMLAGSSADVVPAGNVADIAAVVAGRYEQYRRAVYPVRLAADERFSRRAQAQPLFEALARLTAERCPP